MEEISFSKDRPCSKVEVWNAFHGDGAITHGGMPATDLARARAIIGRHVPRALRKQGRAFEVESQGQYLLVLTEGGDSWLRTGTLRYLKNHPERVDEVENLPIRWRKQIG